MIISVIIPVYNQAHSIFRAMESVSRQDWGKQELIIVNDGSTDNLETVLNQCTIPFEYEKQENLGPSAARNRGIERANGEYLAFLDADDHWPLKRQSQLIEAFDSTLFVVFGKVQEEGQAKWLPTFGSALFHKRAFDTVGLLDETLRFSEDQDWFLRAKELELPMRAIPEVTQHRTIHSESATFNKTWKELEIHQVLKRSIDRRRAIGRQQLRTLSSYGEEG